MFVACLEGAGRECCNEDIWSYFASRSVEWDCKIMYAEDKSKVNNVVAQAQLKLKCNSHKHWNFLWILKNNGLLRYICGRHVSRMFHMLDNTTT